MAVVQLDGHLYRDMLAGGAACLGANAETVNDLNVFPIPDGDTGDNMRMTMEGGLSAPADGDLGDVADAAAQGMLLGARGNSGVILSQFFGGIAEGLRGVEQADAACLGAAFEMGVHRAYEAVIKPTEGTILTVAREATEAAVTVHAENIESFFEAFIDAMERSLARTPDLLPVLKEAGVIDSGGAGLVYIMQGMYRVLRGETVEDAGYIPPAAAHAPDTSSFTADSVMEFGYCTECLLQLQNSKVDTAAFDVAVIIEFLESVGDSIVAVKAGTVVKIHVHTFTPGRVLEFCQQFGEFLTLKVENMCIQHNETTIENRYGEQAPVHKEFAVVAVASGEGLIEAFTQFGADGIVSGGQTMNPSAEDFIAAFKKIRADHIIVMPNNSNIILAARQAASLYTDTDVRVLETRTMAEGYVAFTMLDFTSGDIEQIMEDLQTAVSEVDTGLVTYAVRDTALDGVQVHKDDFIGFSGKTMLCATPDRVSAACGLLDRMDLTDKQVIIAICGKDASAEELAAVREYASAHFPDLEWYELDGKQEVYSFIFAVE